jgi:hypothetical protein
VANNRRAGELRKESMIGLSLMQSEGLKQAFRIAPLRSTMKFYLTVMLIIPTFQTFYVDVYITKIEFSVINVSCTVLIVLVVTITYKIWFENKEAKNLVRIGLAFLSVHYLAAFVIFHYGRSDLYFLLIKTALFEVYNAFVWLTGFVLIAKMVPPEVSITVMAIYQTIFFCSQFVFGRLLAALLSYLGTLVFESSWSLTIMFLIGFLSTIFL